MDKFIRISEGNIFQRSQILSLRKSKPSKGADNVTRTWIIRVTAESVGGVQYTNIWLTDEEGRALEALLLASEK